LFLVYVFIVIAIFAQAMSNAFPQTMDYEPMSLVDRADFVRREDYDPYGFNSILSRFHKRSKSIKTLKHPRENPLFYDE